MNTRSPALLGALASAFFCLSNAAVAQTSKPETGLTEAQVTAKLKAAGYAKVHGVEKEGTHFDADAMKDGKAVHLHVDAATGAITVAPNEMEEGEEHEEHEKHT